MLSTQEQPKRFAEVHGKKMAYVEEGSGPPIVFLHGNPTSAYIWRNILPVVAPHARCIAPDLIGMGDSEKIEGSNPARYGFLEHRQFLEALLGRLAVTDNVVLVGHDWGGALAIDWARRHPESDPRHLLLRDDDPASGMERGHALRTLAVRTVALARRGANDSAGE